jgi:uncharacterized protein (TIGR03663 family)
MHRAIRLRMAKGDLLYPALILFLGAAIRFAFLDIKPPHFDEGINGWFCDQMAKNGYYSYDPNNYHGPLHFYVLFISLMSFGRNLWALRLPVVLISLLTIYWIFLFRPFFGRTVCYLTSLAMAISPGFVFYNRYSIHESWLVFFLIVTLWGTLGIWRSREPRYFWGSVMGVTGMILTKETYIIHLFALLCAALGIAILSRLFPSGEELSLQQNKWPRNHLLAAVTVSLALIIFFYSGNFQHWEGLADLFKTFLPWTKTGIEAAGHGKPNFDLAPLIPPPLAQLPLFASLANFKLNWYWIRLFLDYEWLVMAGLVFSFPLLFWGQSGLRFLAIYSLVVLLIYSVVPYKTPWCVISIAWPFLFLGAAGLKFIAMRINRLAAILVALPLFGHAAWKSYDLNFVRFDNPKERYAYVQTFREYHTLIDPILAKLAKDPEAKTELKGIILLSSYFPIPWVLGDVADIGYYSKEDKWPKDINADFIVVDADKADELEKGLKGRYFIEDFRLRDGMDESRVYFKANTFQEIFPGRQPDFDLGQSET